MALTEHTEPGCAFRLRVVFSAGSCWGEGNVRETCGDTRVRPGCPTRPPPPLLLAEAAPCC